MLLPNKSHSFICGPSVSKSSFIFFGRCCLGLFGSERKASYELNKSIPEIDSKMEEFARELGVDYISLFKEMCSDAGCLVRIGDSLTTFDYGHLSPDASRFLVNKIGGRLINGLFQTSKN